ncbi:MAG: hypothetical protein JRH18_01265 [Deltaproteobacteria bacterium]|nr:hypothetical protein [Deltaproteobacteria bacterium]MBW2150278.1 hypothetical protein [Deltaproteobacteria bacterium]
MLAISAMFLRAAASRLLSPAMYTITIHFAFILFLPPSPFSLPPFPWSPRRSPVRIDHPEKPFSPDIPACRQAGEQTCAWHDTLAV